MKTHEWVWAACGHFVVRVLLLLEWIDHSQTTTLRGTVFSCRIPGEILIVVFVGHPDIRKRSVTLGHYDGLLQKWPVFENRGNSYICQGRSCFSEIQALRIIFVWLDEIYRMYQIILILMVFTFVELWIKFLNSDEIRSNSTEIDKIRYRMLIWIEYHRIWSSFFASE